MCGSSFGCELSILLCCLPREVAVFGSLYYHGYHEELPFHGTPTCRSFFNSHGGGGFPKCNRQHLYVRRHCFVVGTLHSRPCQKGIVLWNYLGHLLPCRKSKAHFKCGVLVLSNNLFFKRRSITKYKICNPYQFEHIARNTS